MKQYITINQWNELNNSQRDILHKYLGIIGDTSFHGIDCPEKYYSRVLLNIGQMIELLDDNNYWKINKSVLNLGMIPRETICDDLWEAVKEVL